MATGIVSIAMLLLGLPQLAHGLYVLNQLLYVFLVILYVLRFTFFRQAFIDDISDHVRGAGFFTIIAGTCIVGSQAILIEQSFEHARAFLLIAAVLWLGLIYLFFAAITIRRQKPSLEKGINGIWLVSVVATQAISILATLLSKQFGNFESEILFCSLSLFFIGGIFYFLIITLIFYRLTFFKMDAEQFAPPYWINMGALAITTLAGSHLVIKSSQWSFLVEISPFLKGATVLFWAVGTWWIPLIVILGGWRHISGQMPFVYHPQYWGMVFPLGMYAVATYRMAEAFKFGFLSAIPTVFGYLALAAWSFTFLGLFGEIIKGVRESWIKKNIEN